MVFGLFASVANDLMFLSVQVRWLIYLLRSTYLSCTVYFNTCYGPLTCLVLCILIPATVHYTCLVLCIFTVSKLQFRHRAARLRTHGFWLGFRWCSAFSHPLPTTACFCLCRFGCLYIPATVQLPVLTCVLCILCILTVSKLQFRHRAARLRTHGFRLGFGWCSAFSHPLPTTACFCLYTFGCSYTCYGPLTCLDLCILSITVSKLQFRHREARLRTHAF